MCIQKIHDDFVDRQLVVRVIYAAQQWVKDPAPRKAEYIAKLSLSDHEWGFVEKLVDWYEFGPR